MGRYGSWRSRWYRGSTRQRGAFERRAATRCARPNDRYCAVQRVRNDVIRHDAAAATADDGEANVPHHVSRHGTSTASTFFSTALWRGASQRNASGFTNAHSSR